MEGMEGKIVYYSNPFEKLADKVGGVRTFLIDREATQYGKEHVDELRRLARQHTETTLHIAKQRAEELGIKTILVASTTGYTGVKAVETFSGCRIIVVTHSTGNYESDVQELTEENRQIIESKEGTVLTTIHAFGALGSMPRQPASLFQVGQIVSNTLRIFGEGMKVVCEISLMAADNGLIRTDEDVISIAGSGRGADTAVVLRPVNFNRFFNLRIREILCKPHL